MTREEKLKIIDYVIRAKREIEKTIKMVDEIFCQCPESEFNKIQWAVFDRIMVIAEIALNDNGHSHNTSWLEWFVWENDCGDGGLGAGHDELLPVETADDLLDLIEG